MKKNLFKKSASIKIIARAETLSSDKRALWGKMTATEMLFHCNLANTQILEGQMEYKLPTFKQRLIKIISLYLVPQFPKNIKGAEINDTKGHIDDGQFEEQLIQFFKIIQKFPKHKDSTTFIHPAFGPLTKKQWGLAAWKHMDHHLRQFGV